jgi:dTDP-4-amino-4,6-dideoxygalactose transaminase
MTTTEPAGPIRTTPFPTVNDLSGRRIGAEELEAVTRVINSGQLNSTVGGETRAWEQEFGAYCGVEHVVACSSGTSALHLAVAAVNPGPGDEIITTGLSDAGTVLPILGVRRRGAEDGAGAGRVPQAPRHQRPGN